MTKTQHRILSTIALTLTGITGLLAATDPSALGVAPHTWGFMCLGISIVGVGVQAVRQAFESDTVTTVTK